MNIVHFNHIVLHLSCCFSPLDSFQFLCSLHASFLCLYCRFFVERSTSFFMLSCCYVGIFHFTPKINFDRIHAIHLKSYALNSFAHPHTQVHVQFMGKNHPLVDDARGCALDENVFSIRKINFCLLNLLCIIPPRRERREWWMNESCSFYCCCCCCKRYWKRISNTVCVCVCLYEVDWKHSIIMSVSLDLTHTRTHTYRRGHMNN